MCLVANTTRDTAPLLVNFRSKGANRLRLILSDSDQDKTLRIVMKQSQTSSSETPRLGFFEKRHWIPLKVKQNSQESSEEVVLLNMDSLVNRVRAYVATHSISYKEKLLFEKQISKEFVKKLAKEHQLETFLNIIQQRQTAAHNVHLDLTQRNPKFAQTLSEKDLEDILHYTEEQPIQQDVYYCSRSTGLKRSFIKTKDDIVICFTKKEDTLLGQGSFKKVHLGYGLSKRKFYATASGQELDPEIDHAKLLPQGEGFVLYHTPKIAYAGKHPTKHRILEDFYNGGDLWDAIFDPNMPRLTDEQQQIIAVLLLDSLAKLEKLQLVHRDIKPGNILLKKTQQGFYLPFFADLESLCTSYTDDVATKLHMQALHTSFDEVSGGTYVYCSPEYTEAEVAEEEAAADPLTSKQALQKAQVARKKVTTCSNDVWALGCSLYEQCMHSVVPWNRQDFTRSQMADLMKQRDVWFPEPQNKPFLHIIWEMLDPNPATRIKASRALEQMKQAIPEETMAKIPSLVDEALV